MQNEADPLKRITVTNSWAEANLMQTLRIWRHEAARRGLDRIAELSDYLQADELTHVKLVTRWIRELVDGDPAQRDELIRWAPRPSSASSASTIPTPRWERCISPSSGVLRPAASTRAPSSASSGRAPRAAP
jgi:hypothetical protein